MVNPAGSSSRTEMHGRSFHKGYIHPSVEFHLMSSKGEGTRIIAGAVLILLGAAIITVPFLPGAPVQGLVGNAAPEAATTWGAVGVGVLIVVLGFLALRSDAHEEDAFEELERPQPAPRQRPSASASSSTRKQAKQPAKEVPEDVKRMRALEARIKKINRRINQAKVKLGTGKLSPEGYKRIVDDLSEKRAKLEQERVDLELDSQGY